MGASLVYLEKPITKKETTVGQGLGFRYAASSMQGWRLSMEDGHICNPELDKTGAALFAVFDGHGGVEVAKFCERHFEQALLTNRNWESKAYGKALEETFIAMDQMLMTPQGRQELHQISIDNPPKQTPLKRAAQMSGIRANKEL